MPTKKQAFDDLPDHVQRTIFHANDMLWLWRELNKQDKDGRGWYELKARQAYHDALLSLKRCGLIESYDCVDIRTKVNGQWYPNRQKLVFVPDTGE